MIVYVLTNPGNRNVYWSQHHGWTSLEDADFFQHPVQRPLLPNYAKWREIKESTDTTLQSKLAKQKNEIARLTNKVKAQKEHIVSLAHEIVVLIGDD